MEFTTIISIITSLGMFSSMILNWVQYRSGKRGTQLSNYEKQLEILEKLQQTKDRGYQDALKCKDLEIDGLKRDISELRSKLEENTNRLVTLQNAVNRLIGGGCKKMKCQQREPYPIDELGDVLGLISDR